MLKGILLSSDVQVVPYRAEYKCVVPVLITESTREDGVREDGVLVVEVASLVGPLQRGEVVEVWASQATDVRGRDAPRYILATVRQRVATD